MAQPLLMTFRDAIDACTDFVGQQSVSASQRDIRRAIQMAYREFGSAHNWTWLLKQGRIQGDGYTSTTCTYDHTGGSSERLLTTVATLPLSVDDYYVAIGENVHAIEYRLSATTCTLDVTMNPGADVAAGTTCRIFPAYYILPHDFLSMAGPYGQADWQLGRNVSPEEWMALTKYYALTESDDLRYYTVMPIADLHGAMGLYVHPPFDSDYQVDFMYRRQPRQLRYTGFATADSAGTVTVTAGSASVTGTSTTFASGMAGSVIRFGSDATNVPSAWDGLYPFAEERVIYSYTSGTAVTLDEVSTPGHTGVKYVVSDPIDIPESTYDAFLKCCFKHIAVNRNMKNKGEFMAAYQQALDLARMGDSRVTHRRVAGARFRPYVRLADSPLGTDYS